MIHTMMMMMMMIEMIMIMLNRGSSITVEPPNGSIHRFNGSLHCRTAVDSKQLDRTLTEKNLLLRGSGVRATEW